MNEGVWSGGGPTRSAAGGETGEVGRVALRGLAGPAIKEYRHGSGRRNRSDPQLCK
jgi:hypothetical protein